MSTNIDSIVSQWIVNYDAQQELSEQLKESRSANKQLEEHILNHIESNDISEINFNNHTFFLKLSTLSAPINEKYIKGALDEFFKTKSKLNSTDCTDFLLNNRPQVEKKSLKHKTN